MKALYLCDRKRCPVCGEYCIRTSDIHHAVNFERISASDDVYVEVDNDSKRIPIEWIEQYMRDYPRIIPIEKTFVQEMIKKWMAENGQFQEG